MKEMFHEDSEVADSRREAQMEKHKKRYIGG
jgi:hypothetical protein